MLLSLWSHCELDSLIIHIDTGSIGQVPRVIGHLSGEFHSVWRMVTLSSLHQMVTIEL